MTTMEWMHKAKVYPMNRIKNLCVTYIDYAARNALKIKSETTHFIVRWRRIHEDGVRSQQGHGTPQSDLWFKTPMALFVQGQ